MEMLETKIFWYVILASLLVSLRTTVTASVDLPCNVSGSVVVCLYPCAILAVEHLAVFEKDVCDVIVAFTAYTTYTQAMTACNLESVFIEYSIPRYCLPSQYIFETAILSPLVMATQSSWFRTVESLSIMPLVLDMSNPSVL